MWNRIVGFFLSIKLTITLLVLSMVLVFAGTLAQVDQGLWTVVDDYFRSVVAWIDVGIFFPRNIEVPSLKFPFPGGFLLGFLLMVNLVAVHAANFKVLALGKRLWIGWAVLGLGVLVTIGVMKGWGTASVAATEDDAFWRVFWRLGRGTIAAVVLYVASVLLYYKRAGMVLLHAGILFLLIGESFTAFYAQEASLVLEEGETTDFVDHTGEVELAFREVSDPEWDWETTIPESRLEAGEEISAKALPFRVKVNGFMKNTSQPRILSTLPQQVTQGYPAYRGQAARWYVVEQSPHVGAGGQIDAPAVDVELVGEDGQSLGRYLFTLWFYPNYNRRQLDLPERIGVGNRLFEGYLRQKREYLVSEQGNPYTIRLIDFRHERYEGTQKPKDFSSHIELINEREGVERELRIWMNNPLRYAKRTFYQSAFLPEDRGTVLQVVRNDSWMIPYLSCMIVFVGMAGQFVQSLRRFSVQTERN
jgi:hypothetical protein